MVEIKVLAEKGAVIPVYKTEGSAGADVSAFLPSSSLIINPHEFRMIRTGLRFEIPQGYEIQVRPRSGLAAKNGITVLNTPGTIDSDYRGELKIILASLSEEPFTINFRDRIAQIVFSKVEKIEFEEVESLSESIRGEGGFGSTNK